ncbi:MAG: hypothetical protein II621_00955, partial [Clostridia bacterium]|nr:hypothetical protein [Clostridia bacterium]
MLTKAVLSPRFVEKMIFGLFHRHDPADVRQRNARQIVIVAAVRSKKGYHLFTVTVSREVTEEDKLPRTDHRARAADEA